MPYRRFTVAKAMVNNDGMRLFSLKPCASCIMPHTSCLKPHEPRIPNAQFTSTFYIRYSTFDIQPYFFCPRMDTDDTDDW